MVSIDEVQRLISELMTEHDAIVQQREIVRKEEERLRTQGAELDRKITGIKQSLQGLSLYTTAKNEPPGLTKTITGLADMLSGMEDIGKSRLATKTLSECCREILIRSGEWMSALEVRQSLHAAGFDFSEYKSNPLSSIHTTLKRIAESGQAWTHYDSKNETYYRWIKEGEKVAPGLETAVKNTTTVVRARKKGRPGV